MAEAETRTRSDWLGRTRAFALAWGLPEPAWGRLARRER